jgi:hypothetical protein
MISWDADTFTGTSLLVETRFSTDGGVMWSPWSPAANNGPVPGLMAGMPMDQARLQTRVSMATMAPFASPFLYALNLLVVNDSTASGIAGTRGDDTWLAVYPNPSKASVTVSCRLPEPSGLAIRVYSSLGRLVWHREWAGAQAGYRQLVIPASELPVAPGLYWVELDTGGRSVKQKLVRY